MIWAQWRSWPCRPMRPQSLCPTSSTARATSFIWMRKQSGEQVRPFLRKLSPSWTKVSAHMQTTWIKWHEWYLFFFSWDGGEIFELINVNYLCNNNTRACYSPTYHMYSMKSMQISYHHASSTECVLTVLASSGCSRVKMKGFNWQIIY